VPAGRSVTGDANREPSFTVGGCSQCPRIAPSPASRPTKLPSAAGSANASWSRSIVIAWAKPAICARHPSFARDTSSVPRTMGPKFRFASHTPSGIVVAAGLGLGAGTGAGLDDEVFPQPQRVIAVSSGTMAVPHALMARTERRRRPLVDTRSIT
jgi:hypothetical protein